MKMLECLAMLTYLLEKLQAGKRVQVPVGVYEELKTVLIPLFKKVSTFSNEETQFKLNALMEAVNLVNIPAGSMYLTDLSRDALVDGITEVKESIALQAFEHFKVNDFEPTEEIIPIMQDVVRVAAMKGVV